MKGSHYAVHLNAYHVVTSVVCFLELDMLLNHAT